MYNPIDEVTRVKKTSMMLLKRVNVSNKNEYRKLDGYLKFLNIDKKNTWKSIRADENNFEKKLKKFQLDVSKVKSNLSKNEIKNLSLVSLPRFGSTKSTKSGATANLTRKSAAPTNITKFTLKLDEGINEVARTNHALIDDELDQLNEFNEKNSCDDYTEQINRKQSVLNNNFNYAEYYFKRLNTSDSIQLEKKPIKLEDVNETHDHVSIGLPSITSGKSNFQTENLDSFYSTQVEDFNESNYFQHLVEKRFAYKFKAKQLSKNKFSCHYN